METPLPDNFGISESVRTWATGKGFNRLKDHLEAFKDYALSRGKTYADWDAAFKRAVRENWAKLESGNGQSAPAPKLPEDPPGILVFDPNCPVCHGDGFKTMGKCKCARTREEIRASQKATAPAQ